ncbi:MAG TPA: helix-turn-helix domain-containing protein [Chitinophagaceae bacterium]|jgi:transcriptional regulator GlxA family with amidase domain
MKHVSILIPAGQISLVNVEGTLQIFTEVNSLRVERGNTPLFKIQLVGLANENDQHNGLFNIKPDVMVQDVSKTDLIIIPAMMGDPQKAAERNAAFVPWIVRQYQQGAEVACFCIGVFFLASTGLLDNKQCTTHWRFISDFKSMFPAADVVNDKIMTEDSGIYTSGGAYSYLNLLLYLIEKYAGREIAILIAKTFMIDIDRVSQSPFIIFQGQKEHDDEPVKKAQEFIEKNFQDKITVEQLASMYALSRRNLERRFKKATCNTVTEYIQRVKIEAAKKNFESSMKNINEVMYDVGYMDTKAFRTTFKKITGLSPIEYRKKYNRELAVA